ncbi:peptidoglycan-binding protein LysM [Flavobacterium rhizosphaerae]|uniref:Peptidoglycan-binding protein LysM n=1 Tax=Flavobacterium rhizosphaerae TaxID=3163298 RepID=A0ABW8YX12_9FLAO
MIKKWLNLTGLLLLVLLVTTGFTKTHVKQFGRVEGFHLAKNEIDTYTVAPAAEASKEIKELREHYTLPYTGKSFVGFKQAIGIKESQCLYRLISSYGYMGKYQFGKSALQSVGVYNTDKFLHNPALQERAFKALLSINKWQLRHEIKRYSGTTIAGINITESGILAAAHLAGAQSVKNFLRSNGKVRFRDGFGTTLKSYLKSYSGYDTSVIKANPNARVQVN